MLHMKIVIGTQGLTGIDNFLMVSTTEKVVHRRSS
jgi:nucleotide-binding universal stress UspA family protein